MVSSCLSTRRHSWLRVSVGTVVVEVAPERALRSFRSVLGLLLSRSDGGEMPRWSICAFVSKFPQILDAASMPSPASDAVSIKEKNGQVQKCRALSTVLLETAKLTGGAASQSQPMITQICLILQKVVFPV